MPSGDLLRFCVYFSSLELLVAHWGLPLYSIRGVERKIKDDNDNDDDNNIRDSSERCHRWRALARTRDSRFVSTGSESE